MRLSDASSAAGSLGGWMTGSLNNELVIGQWSL